MRRVHITHPGAHRFRLWFWPPLLASIGITFDLWQHPEHIPMALSLAVLVVAVSVVVLRLLLIRRAHISPHITHPSDTRSRYIPKYVRSQVLRRDHYQCKYCKAKDYLEVDHIIPYAQGGSNDPQNLQVLCRHCNLAKGDR